MQKGLGWVLGDAFELIETRRHQHSTPWGPEQRYQFSVFRRLTVPKSSL